jgi:hypothetical protein
VSETQLVRLIKPSARTINQSSIIWNAYPSSLRMCGCGC